MKLTMQFTDAEIESLNERAYKAHMTAKSTRKAKPYDTLTQDEKKPYKASVEAVLSCFMG